MNDRPGTPADSREAIRKRIRRLQARASRGLWLLCLFLALSLLLLRMADRLPRLPAEPHFLLGTPPSAGMISAALVVYAFSAIVLTLTRIASDVESGDGLHHIGFLSAFYAFYHFAGALKDNFWAVFAAGATILGLVAYNNWGWEQEGLREEHERLERLDRAQEPREKT